MDNFFWETRYPFYMKSTHVGVNKNLVFFLGFANFLLFKRLSCLSCVIFTDKWFNFLYYLRACDYKGFAVCIFVDNS